MQPVTEQELVKRSEAPRVTLEALEANIRETYFINAGEAVKHMGQPESPDLNCLTICILVLNNGYTVMAESACADPANFKKDIGERIAFDNAKKKIWALMGYSLKQEIYLNNDGTFVGRMEREAKELGDKLAKLEVFFTSQKYESLPLEEQKLLSAQRINMAEYHQILMRRLANHTL